MIDAWKDAVRAAKCGNEQEFEYHVHEVQDWYAHVYAGYESWHLRKAVDDPNRPENQSRYKSADDATMYLENIWDQYNLPFY